MRVLLDTNIVIDALQNREPWYHDAQQVFRGAIDKKFIGCITAKEAADIHYFMKKFFKGQENTDQKAREVLTSLFHIFELLDTKSTDCEKAVDSNCPDYEDAVMIETAIREKMDYIITRNVRDYINSPIPVLSPSDFLGTLVI